MSAGGRRQAGQTAGTLHSERSSKFEGRHAATKDLAGTRDKAAIVGDFNAPHTLSGYAKTSPNMFLLERTATALGLRAINQIGKPTRTGNSISRDTVPDHDVTIWTVGGTVGEQEALQEAVDVIARYAETCRLQRAAEMLELLIIEKHSREGTAPAPAIHLRIGPRKITQTGAE
ncbi:hypothetical protein HPB49_011810 [Dermacentor silvarum]|uniref:Uncharacterized protein n=1 Tax=Dermacentor silvarum TaxID=543639 RepID=A0ACB8CQZ1_DERSI|nr:hypothetical protein HPB49_011810 [Dermacentor silvarum]